MDLHARPSGSDYVTLVIVDTLVLFQFQAGATGGNLLKSKAKWAITLRSDASEASKKEKSPSFVRRRASTRSTFISR